VICITYRYVFPCQQWLSTSKGDGQIARELVPYDPSRKKSVADSMLEDRGQLRGDEIIRIFSFSVEKCLSQFTSSV